MNKYETITRSLMEELQEIAMEAIERCQRKHIRDWAAIKSAIKTDLSGYLYKHTKRNPMILPVITEIWYANIFCSFRGNYNEYLPKGICPVSWLSLTLMDLFAS